MEQFCYFKRLASCWLINVCSNKNAIYHEKESREFIRTVYLLHRFICWFPIFKFGYNDGLLWLLVTLWEPKWLLSFLLILLLH